MPGQIASQTRPEGGRSPRRTWVYVEGCGRPRTKYGEVKLARGFNREYVDAQGRAVSHVTDETTNRALWKHYRQVMAEA